MFVFAQVFARRRRQGCSCPDGSPVPGGVRWSHDCVCAKAIKGTMPAEASVRQVSAVDHRPGGGPHGARNRRRRVRPAEESFDRLARLAARLVGAPVALVTAVDRDRQYFKSCLGLPEPWATRRETPLSHSFCQHVVTAREPVLVPDARQDPRFIDNRAIRDLGVTAYLGVPLITAD